MKKMNLIFSLTMILAQPIFAGTPKSVINFLDIELFTTANHCKNRDEVILPIFQALQKNPELDRVERDFELSFDKISSLPQYEKISKLMDPGLLRIAFQIQPNGLELAAYIFDPLKKEGWLNRQCWDLGDEVVKTTLYSEREIGQQFEKHVPARIERDEESREYEVPAEHVFTPILGYPDAPMAANNQVIYQFKEEFLTNLLDKLIPILEKNAEAKKLATAKQQADDESRNLKMKNELAEQASTSAKKRQAELRFARNN